MGSREYIILQAIFPLMPNYGIFNVFNLIRTVPPEYALQYTGTQEMTIRDYLISEGFALDKGFVDPNGYLIELTDRGRKLKELGSVDKYNQYLFDTKIHANKMEKYTYRIQLAIAIATGIAAIYYFIEILKNFRSCH